MSENLVVNGKTYNDVDSVAMQNEAGETVQYYADAVRYVAQELTEEQKAQARANIGVTAGTGDVESNVFVATYGVTTYAEIAEAVNTGKLCVSVGGEVIKTARYILTEFDNLKAVFSGTFADTLNFGQICAHIVSSSNVWSDTRYTTTNEISSKASNRKMTTEKAVYNYAQPKGEYLTYTSQTLTAAQQEQARANIGAVGATELSSAVDDALDQAKASGDFDGDKGEKGDTGSAGKDGVSATHSWNGTILTVTSASGTTSANLKGEKGDTGEKGAKGDKGDPGQDAPQESVLYTEQELTEEQKAQARANIGAAAAEVPREKAEIIVSFKANAAINNNNQFTTYEASAGVACRYTNIIPVIEGDRFSYTGGSASLSSHPNAIFFDSNENIVSVEKWGANITNGCKLVTVPPGVAFVRFCDSGYWGVTSEDQLNENRKLHFEVLHMPREDEEREIVVNGRVGGYYNSTTYGWFAVDGMCAKRTDPIPVSESDTFYWTTADGGRSYMHWYDVNGTRIAVVTGDGTQMTLTPPADAVMARFFAYSYSTNLDICILNVAYKTEDKTIEYLQGMNYLWGKKYVACGDSFTAGDFAEKTEETWDDAMQEYKTYCWHIAKRNRMQLVNEAISGSTMYNKDSNSFSVTRYTAVPKDADYITLCFGLNDQTAGADIGTLQDTTNATVIGAWNVVLEYLITNIPYAKIGIIIADAYLNSTMRDALVSVAKYWGIPYLDLKGDPKVPMLIGGRYSDVTVSSKAIQLRNAAFQISETDSHPNAKGHAYRSTIIENFMRSL